MRKLFTWDRSDYVFTRGVTIAIPLIVAAVYVGLPLLDWLLGDPLVGIVDTDAIDTALPADLAPAGPGATLTWDGMVQFEIAEPSAWLRLVALLPGVMITAAGFAIAITFYRLVDATEAGQPFAQAIRRSLQITGWLSFGAALLVPLATSIADSFLLHEAIDGSVDRATYSLNLAWLGLSLFLLFLAELLRLGGKLADDVEGLV